MNNSTIGCIGVFADGAHSISYICPALYEQFQAWIWILPGANGVHAAEWAVRFPAMTPVLSTVRNPGITVAFGVGSCQRDWVWMYQLSMISLAVVQTCIEIIPHPEALPVHPYQVVTCEPDYASERLIYLTPLYLCTTWGVEQSSWGGIKSLF